MANVDIEDLKKYCLEAASILIRNALELGITNYEVEECVQDAYRQAKGMNVPYVDIHA